MSRNDFPFDKVRQEFDRVLDTLRHQGEKAMDAFGIRPPGSTKWYPAVDIVETPENVIVTCDVPGLDPLGVEVLLVGNMLSVKGRRPTPIATADEVVHRRECASGPFERAVPIPVPVDPDKVSAEVRNGVLTVTLGKREVSRPRQIRVEIRSGVGPEVVSGHTG